ncbi:Ca2+-binding RTX toxin-like protein [Shinella sp. BE166]|uniref:calcium-binding protein n=1 Tax=Shinella sp. BE166 TaxID=3373918 RepID=UPI003EC058A8
MALIMGGISLVNTQVDDVELESSVTGLSDGGWVVTWIAYDLAGTQSEVLQQAFNANGTRRGVETRIDALSADLELSPSVTALADGGWVVSFSTFDGTTEQVLQQRFDANGNTVGPLADISPGLVGDDEYEQSTTALPDGGWIVTWTLETSGGDTSIYQQRFDLNGVSTGLTQLSSSTGDLISVQPSVATLADGGWVTVWTIYDFFNDSFELHIRTFDADGTPRDSETLTSANYDDYGILDPIVTTLADGGWVVTWTSEYQDGDSLGIYQQAFNADGSMRGVESRVNTTTFDAQALQTAASLPGGGWVVAWADSSGEIFQQVFDRLGRPVGRETLVSGADFALGYPSIAVLDDGSWVISWSGNSAEDDIGIFQRKFTLETVTRPHDPPTTKGTDGADQLFGTNGRDIVDGGKGDDTIFARGGNDTVFGGQDDDTIGGGDGNDDLQGGDGKDALFGGKGNDTLLGGTGEDKLYGGDGNDSLNGGDGDDQVYGGKGSDTFFGGKGHDTMGGGDGADTLRGEAGNDTLYGGAGNDRLEGGAGADNLFGGLGADILAGGAGRDVLTGGKGADVFLFTAKGDSGTDARTRDTITDFSAKGGDKIDLSKIALDNGSGTTPFFKFLGQGDFTGKAGELRYEIADGKTTVFSDIDGDGTADFSILLDGKINLKATDFIL